MKNLTLFVLLILIIITGCFSRVKSSKSDTSIYSDSPEKSNKESIEERYNRFIKGCILIKKNSATKMNMNSIGFVELTENPATGYRWHYKILGSAILEIFKDEIFNFNKPDLLGGSFRHVWKFRALQRGRTKVIFKCFRNWEGEEKSIDSCEFELIVY